MTQKQNWEETLKQGDSGLKIYLWENLRDFIRQNFISKKKVEEAIEKMEWSDDFIIKSGGKLLLRDQFIRNETLAEFSKELLEDNTKK